MIKNFEEFVNEGLWKNGVERAKSGKDRIEKGIKTKFGNYCTIQDKQLMENTISNLFKYYLGKPHYLMRIVRVREGVQIFDKMVKNKLDEGWPTAFLIDEKGEVALDAVDAETYSEHFEEINEVDYHNIVKCIAEVFSTIRFNRNKEDNKYYNMIVVDKSEGSEKIWSMVNRENYRNLIKDKFGIEPIIMSSKVMLPITYENTIVYHKVVELTKDFLSKL